MTADSTSSEVFRKVRPLRARDTRRSEGYDFSANCQVLEENSRYATLAPRRTTVLGAIKPA